MAFSDLLFTTRLSDGCGSSHFTDERWRLREVSHPGPQSVFSSKIMRRRAGRCDSDGGRHRRCGLQSRAEKGQVFGYFSFGGKKQKESTFSPSPNWLIPRLREACQVILGAAVSVSDSNGDSLILAGVKTQPQLQK